jgi:glycosyltransferase involved in cell wall biosynthesis
MLISVIIPVFNNAGSLPKLIKKFQELSANSISDNFEFIFIDDGSTDNSYEILREIYDNSLTGISMQLIRFTRNFGQVAGILAGYQNAKGNLIVNISADLQDPPELIPQMVEEYHNGYEVIIGERAERDESYYRKITSSIFYKIMKKWCFPELPAGGFDYVMISKKIREIILSNYESNPFWQGQILWTGFTSKRIKYKREKRLEGNSGWTFNKKIKYLIDGILAYSYYPMRLMSTVGIFISLIGFLYAILIITFKILGKIPQPGWAPIMVIILVLFGINMLMTGIIGEYLWRTLDQVRKRPLYIIKEILTDNAKKI